MKYDDSAIPSTYARARDLPQAAVRSWLSAVADNVDPGGVTVCLDLGCGTGRFSEALADHFNCVVVATDPSLRMLTQLRSGTAKAVRRVVAPGERIPIGANTVDLVFMSMVYHHLNTAEAIPELFRVTAERSVVFVRNTTREGLSRVPYLRYFPEAWEAAWEFLPETKSMSERFSAAGFGLQGEGVVEQELCQDWAEYCERISLRAVSDLAAISDEAFSRGMRKMRAELARPEEPVVEGIEFFVFSRTPATVVEEVRQETTASDSTLSRARPE